MKRAFWDRRQRLHAHAAGGSACRTQAPKYIGAAVPSQPSTAHQCLNCSTQPEIWPFWSMKLPDRECKRSLLPTASRTRLVRSLKAHGVKAKPEQQQHLVEGGHKVADDHMLLPQVELQRVHALVRLHA